MTILNVSTGVEELTKGREKLFGWPAGGLLMINAKQVTRTNLNYWRIFTALRKL